MIIKEKYTKTAKLNKLSGSIVFFANKNSEIKNINNLLNISETNLFKKNLKNNIKKKEIFTFDINHNQKIIIYTLKNDKDSCERNGAKLFQYFKNESLNKIHIFGDTIENPKSINYLHELIHGMKLKSYSFERYLTKKDTQILNINVISKKKEDTK